MMRTLLHDGVFNSLIELRRYRMEPSALVFVRRKNIFSLAQIRDGAEVHAKVEYHPATIRVSQGRWFEISEARVAPCRSGPSYKLVLDPCAASRPHAHTVRE